MFKKLIVVTVAVATIATLGVGFVAPDVAQAASAGSLVKGPNSQAVYYIGANNKKYVFPDAKTYFSWYTNFNNVQLLTVAELDTYTDGGMILYRPGTKMITHPNTAKVYVVEDGGAIRWVSSEAVAAGLFGANWNQRINDISEVFFPNYAIGADLTSATDLPAGSLVKASDGTTIYLISGGKKRPFASMDALTANGYSSANLLTVAAATLTSYADGTSVTGAESSLMDTSQGVTEGIVPLGGALTVSAGSMPAATSIVAGGNTNGAQALVPVMNINFTAGANAAMVKTVKLKKIGLLSDTYVLNVYLYEGNTRLATMNSISSGVVTFNSANGLFTVNAGQAKTVTVKMDLEDSAGSGNTVAFSLESAADVTTDGGAVSGTFPLTGNYMTVATVSDLGLLTVGASVVPSGTTTANAEDNYEMVRVSFAATNQDLEISYLRFTNIGSVTPGDLQNLKLMVGGVQYGTTLAQEDGDSAIAFDVSANPIVLTSGQTKNVSVYGDIKKGSSRTFRWSLQDASDIVVKDKMYNVSIFPKPSGGTAGVWTVVQAGGATTINAGTMTVTKATDSPTANIADAATNVTIGKWALKATGEDVKVNTLTYDITGSDTTDNLKNVKLFLDGVQVGTSTTTAVADGTDYAISMGNSMTIPAGTTKYLTMVVDTTNSTVASAATFYGRLVAGSSNGQATASKSSINVPGSNTAANTLTVAAGSLTSAKNPAIANITAVQGSTNVKLASWVITAGAAEGIDVSSIVVKTNNGTLDGASTGAFGDSFANVSLWNSAKTVQYGQTISTPSTSVSGSNTFNINNLSITAGQSVVIELWGDALSNADANWTDGDGTEIDSVTGTGKTTAASVSDSTGGVGQTLTAATAGTLTVAVSASPTNPNSKILVMGSTDNIVGSWKFSASNVEDLKISQILLSEIHGDDTPGNIASVSLYVDNVLVGGPVPLLSGSPDTATFSDLNITIAKNGYKHIVVKANISDSSNATTNKSAQFRISTPAAITGAAANNIIAKGSTSNQFAALAAASTNYDASAHTTYKTKVTVAMASDTPTGYQIPGQQVNALKFSVTADAAGDATINSLKFTVNTSSATISDGDATLYDVLDYGTALATLSGATFANATEYTLTVSTAITVPAGTTRTFMLKADTAGMSTAAIETFQIVINPTSLDTEFGWRDGVYNSDITSATLTTTFPLTGGTLQSKVN